MKRNFLRLCLMLGLFSLNSCRQDIIPEPEAYNNSGAFQLTSKRISLDEAQHKAKLLPILEQVETKFKGFSKTNAQGRVINYGNGVSIDTDDVTYIENGPNYHTYTFNIKRENAPVDAPLENLVLTPLTDGTYRELLISYNLTPQEKQTLMNGGTVDAKGKTTITELSKGTYNNGGLVNKTTSWSCGWGYEIQYTICSADEHSHGELPISVEGGTCSATTQSVAILVEVYKCDNIEDPNNPSVGNPVGTGPGYAGNPGSPAIEQPGTPVVCNNVGSLTGPQNPSTGTGEGGCVGVPTLPTLPVRNNPCKKIKALVNNAALKIKIDSLKDFSLTAEKDEMGYQQDKAGNVTPAFVNGAHFVDFIIDQNSLGGIHCHTLNGTHMFSPKDILTFLSFAEVQNQTLPIGSTADNTGNAFLGMISQSSSYFITFNGGSGDLPPPMTDAEEDALEIKLNDAYKKIIIELLEAEDKDSWDTLSEKGLQKLLFEIVKEMGLEGKINLIQQDGSNTSTIQQNPDGTIKEPIPC